MQVHGHGAVPDARSAGRWEGTDTHTETLGNDTKHTSTQSLPQRGRTHRFVFAVSFTARTAQTVVDPVAETSTTSIHPPPSLHNARAMGSARPGAYRCLMAPLSRGTVSHCTAPRLPLRHTFAHCATYMESACAGPHTLLPQWPSASKPSPCRENGTNSSLRSASDRSGNGDDDTVVTSTTKCSADRCATCRTSSRTSPLAKCWTDQCSADVMTFVKNRRSTETFNAGGGNDHNTYGRKYRDATSD